MGWSRKDISENKNGGEVYVYGEERVTLATQLCTASTAGMHANPERRLIPYPLPASCCCSHNTLRKKIIIIIFITSVIPVQDKSRSLSSGFIRFLPLLLVFIISVNGP